MAKQKRYLKSSRKYDLPLFCAAWIAPKAEAEGTADGTTTTEEPGNERQDRAGVGHVVFGGGGGDRKNGVKNNLVLAHYDLATDVLSEAIHTISTDDDPPYRLAVHPGSDEIVCSVSKDCRLFELSSDDGLKLKSSEKVLRPLQDVGEQNCLAFSTDGTRFATGGEDGHLRVFDWPSLELVFDQPSAHQSVKDLDFSLDSSLVVSTGDSGPCRVWDIANESAVISLATNKGGNFGFCRFSRDGTKPVLFITLKEAGKGLIGLWDTTSWKKVASKRLSEVPISAFNMSPDGKFLAIGSSEGDVSVVDTKTLLVTQRVRSAHMVFVTSMEFSPNCRALLSVSGDSSARVTALSKPSKLEGLRVYVLMLFVLLISTWLFLALKDHGRERSLGALINDVIAGIFPSNSVLTRTVH